MSSENTQLKWYKQGLGVVALCLVVGVSLSYVDIFATFNQTWIDRDIKHTGLLGEYYFLIVSMGVTALGGPRQLVAFLGGYAFGVVLGTLLALAGTLLGCIASFYTSRLLIRPFVIRKFGKRVARIEQFWQRFPTQKTIVIRLLPVGSNIVTNLIAGASKIRGSAFFTGSAIGYFPQTLIFALLGKGIVIGSEWKIAVSAVLFLISGYLSFSLYSKYKNLTLQTKSSGASLTGSSQTECNG